MSTISGTPGEICPIVAVARERRRKVFHGDEGLRNIISSGSCEIFTKVNVRSLISALD